MNLDEKKKFIINFTYFAALAVIVYLIFKLAAVFLLPFVIGIIIAYAVQKPALFISRKIKIKKQNCAAILSVIIFLGVIVLLSLLGWLLYSQISKFIIYLSNHGNDLKAFVEKIYAQLEFLIQKIKLDSNLERLSNDAINSFIAKVTAFLSSGVTSFIKSMPSVLFSCVVTVVATCYISKDYDRLLRFLKGFLSADFCRRITDIKNIFTDCFLKFSVGYFWLFTITFAELFIGFFVLGIKHSFAIALLVAFLDLLPVIGTGTVLLPWAAVLFFKNEYLVGVGLVFVYLLVIIIRNFIEPKIIGKQTGINPLFTLFFLFIGLRLGGIMGMLILPMVFTVIFTYYRRQISDVD